MYCFWNRFHLPDRARLGVDAAEWDFVAGDGDGPSVLIRSAKKGEIIRESSSLVLRGNGYSSPDEALTEGYRWRDALQASLALLGIGADFGDRRPGGGFTSHALEQAEQRAERPVLNEVPGLQVFRCDPLPLLARANPVSVVVTSNQERTQSVLRTATNSQIRFTDAERLAFDLYSASFFQPSPDARLLTLMMAVETLLELGPRSQEARAHVDELIRLTEEAELPDPERQSMVGSLRWLKGESISKAGRRLSDRLGERTYMGMTPRKFFTECYTMSRLVHGYVPRPSHAEVDKVAANLEVFVGHLLSSSLLDAPG